MRSNKLFVVQAMKIGFVRFDDRGVGLFFYCGSAILSEETFQGLLYS